MQNVKLKSLQPGDQVVLDDGTSAVVKHVETNKVVIPRRTTDVTSIELEIKRKRGNRTYIANEMIHLHGDEVIPLTSRNTFAWKRAQFMKKNKAIIRGAVTFAVGSLGALVFLGLGFIPGTVAAFLVVCSSVPGYVAYACSE